MTGAFDEDGHELELSPMESEKASYPYERPSNRARIIKIIGLGVGTVIAIVLLVLIGGLILSTLFGGPTDDGCKNCNDYKGDRLPKTVIPHSYTLLLEPEFKEFSFTGQETIHLSINQTLKSIVMHSAELSISRAELTADGSEQKLIPSISFNENLEYVYFFFEKSLTPGNYSFYLEFKGTLNDDMRGFYRSKYTYNNQIHWLAVTQFEPTDARRAFPCFDEPTFKAKFTLSIRIPSNSDNLVALSNTPSVSKKRSVDEVEAGSQGELVEFEQTPLMSTYLLAFAVGQYQIIAEQNDYKGRPIRIWAVPGNENQGDFALDIALRSLRFYEDYFAQDYPLPKCDLLAVPDFAAGAMENWGIVTFRSTALLLDASSASAANRERVAIVVAHELAHQWTGNLVTTEWWENLWLNEGFAEYFETECLNGIEPSWEMKDLFVWTNQQVALNSDALLSTHALYNHPVVTPGDINEMFDTITYEKGASVLRMFYGYMGSTVFRRAMGNYIHAYRYSNSWPADLLRIFSETYNAEIGNGPVKDLSPLFSTWIDQPGFPIITVDYFNGDPGQLTLRQDRFLFHSSSTASVPASLTNSTWWVPIKIGTSDGPLDVEITQQQRSSIVRFPRTPTWFKLNMGQDGFYRVNYPLDAWTSLKQNFQTAFASSPPDRSGLLNDAFVIARSGIEGAIPTTVALDLATELTQEREWVVWGSALEELSRISVLLSGEDCFGDFKHYMAQLLNPIITYVGWNASEEDSQSTALLRGRVLYEGVVYNVGSTVRIALQNWEQVKASYNHPGGGKRSNNNNNNNRNNNNSSSVLLDQSGEGLLGMAQSRESLVASRNKRSVSSMAESSFAELMALEGDLRAAVYYAAIHYGTDEDYWTLFDIYQGTSDNAEQVRILKALGSVREYYLLQHTLRICIDPAIVRPQDRTSCIYGVSMNPLGRDLAWDFVQANWETFNQAGFGITGLIRVVTQTFSDEQHLESVQSFFAANPPNGGARTAQQAVESIKNNIAWKSKNVDLVCPWLKARS